MKFVAGTMEWFFLFGALKIKHNCFSPYFFSPSPHHTLFFFFFEPF